MYHVVDGKQRITTILEFVQGKFPVSENSDMSALRGKYFEGLDESVRRAFWSYQLLVEYIPTNDEGVINSIFDRINRNVAKLTAQELRHAKLDGEFIKPSLPISIFSFLSPPPLPSFPLLGGCVVVKQSWTAR